MTAAELIPQIKEAAAELIAAEAEGFRQTLLLQIDLGVLLLQAKATPEVHRRFKKWFLTHEREFGFAYRKAQRCMRYAKRKDELIQKAANAPEMARDHRLGICAADALLRKPRSTQAAKPPKPKPPPRSPSDPEAAIADTAADEVAAIVARQWDQDQREDLLRHLLKSMPPVRVLQALTDAFDQPQLDSLATQMMKRSATAVH
jgi:hypothetical protein